MGRVVNLTPGALKVSLFGDNSEYMGDYLQYQMQNMGHVLGDMGGGLYETLTNSYEYVTDSLRRYSIRNELEREGVVELDYYFEDINSFEGLQNANMVMQRWIMAEPLVKKTYLDQNLDGYGGEYVNVSGDTYGEEDYDYRRVTNNMVMVDEVTGKESLITYIDELIPGDKELDFYDQTHILETWKTIRHIMKTSKHDFTKDSEKPERMNI